MYIIIKKSITKSTTTLTCKKKNHVVYKFHDLLPHMDETKS